MPDGSTKLLTLDEAAQYLRCSVKTLREHIEDSATIHWLMGQIRQAEERGAERERARIYPLLRKAMEARA